MAGTVCRGAFPAAKTTKMRFDHLKRCEFITPRGGAAAALARAHEVCE
jgi:hypothetical protein